MGQYYKIVNFDSIFPLMLLIAFGNGLGMGDYAGEEFTDVGLWCDSSDGIEFVNSVPEGFEELRSYFTEKDKCVFLVDLPETKECGFKGIFKCNVRGHFIEDRQAVLRDIFTDKSLGSKKIKEEGFTFVEGFPYLYKKEFENLVYLKPEPTNQADPNAIAIYLKDGSHIGYVPKEDTGAIREAIDLNNKYETKLILYQGVKRYGFRYDFSEVYADLILYQ